MRILLLLIGHRKWPFEPPVGHFCRLGCGVEADGVRWMFTSAKEHDMSRRLLYVATLTLAVAVASAGAETIIVTSDSGGGSIPFLVEIPIGSL